MHISWTANANINGLDTWENQLAWADGLVIDNARWWRLANMNVDGSMDTASGMSEVKLCDGTSRHLCQDNEYAHLYFYGAGTEFGSGITSDNPGPFSNVQPDLYWSSTKAFPGADENIAYVFLFSETPTGFESVAVKSDLNDAWAVHNGNVGLRPQPIPVPAAVWLFGSALVGLVGVARRRKMTA